MKIVKGDITTLEVDAIVNAANSSLLGGCFEFADELDITFCCFSDRDLWVYRNALAD